MKRSWQLPAVISAVGAVALLVMMALAVPVIQHRHRRNPETDNLRSISLFLRAPGAPPHEAGDFSGKRRLLALLVPKLRLDDADVRAVLFSPHDRTRADPGPDAYRIDIAAAAESELDRLTSYSMPIKPVSPGESGSPMIADLTPADYMLVAWSSGRIEAIPADDPDYDRIRDLFQN